jgi:hypothetical protein
MSRFSRSKTARSKLVHFKTGNCRNLIVSSRVRRQVMAEDLDKIWLELRRHTTIETDAEKLGQLAIDVGKK